MNPLPQTAFAAWQAYNAMTATQQRHRDYLARLEARHGRNGEPNPSESSLLARLLGEHEEQVMVYLGAMHELRDSDTAAHQALLAYITTLNEVLPPGGEEAPRTSRH